ncbi:MAG TPA: carboxypeptidase-like regulatory domain-containing protein, partial [Cytophagaceae bacterium]
MKNRYNIIVFFILFAFGETDAQLDSIGVTDCSLNLSGTVYDGETKEPLYGANISIDDRHAGTVTNIKGEYFITSMCAGTIKVTCEALGYKTVSVSINLTENNFRQFILHSDTCFLESVVITSSRPQELSTQQTLTIEGKALQRTRGLSLGEAIKDLPGVSTLQTGPSIFKPVVQGMYGNRVLILNNGIRQEGQQWGTEHAPEVDPFIASKISIIKGA